MDAPGAHVLLDAWRVVCSAAGLLLAAAFLKVAWLRWHQDVPTVGEVLGWCSHGMFALSASLLCLLRLGHPPMSVVLLVLGTSAVVLGVLAVTEQLGMPRWLARLLSRPIRGNCR